MLILFEQIFKGVEDIYGDSSGNHLVFEVFNDPCRETWNYNDFNDFLLLGQTKK